MSIPAVIFCDPETSTLRIAGLLVIDRLIVAAHRAGAGSITIVSEKPLPPLARTAALGITVKAAAHRPELIEPTLVLSTRVLVQAPDLKRLLEQRGRLMARDGTPLPAGVLTGFTGSTLEEQLSPLPGVAAEGVAVPITGAASAAVAARALWSSLSTSLDGFVDKHFNRPAGHYLSKILVHTPVSPNQVSVVASLIGLAAAWLFAQGHYQAALWGAILFQISAIVDCVDGDLARILFKESRLGRWLDIVGDQVVHISIFAGIGIGLYRARIEDPLIPLVVSAAIGVVIALIVVVRGQLQPESPRKHRLKKLIDATASRDFSVVLLVLTVLDKMSLFLWMAAIGVHIFWLLALGVQLVGQPAPATPNPDRENRS
ncbi:MAG TPA: CDP-alcohol phosphatidyltransferase family protein [Verrucomicrobiae bacterium]|nr:CDP-alcohol phosphatidyltransferase family protein [Verrucomicrobiae bacterium]